MSRSNDSGLFRAEFEYLYDTDNEEPETDKSPEYEAQEYCAVGLLFWEMQQLLAVVARCRELGIDLPDIPLRNLSLIHI